jgi:hypothetical protein
MKNVYSKLKQGLLTAAALVALTACTMNPSGGVPRTGNGLFSASDAPTLSLISANQVLPRYAIMTGVANYRSGTGTPTAVETSETNFRAALSADGGINGFSSQMMLALIDISSSFCQMAVTRENALPVDNAGRLLYPGVNLSAALPAGGLSDAQIDALVTATWARFRPNMDLDAATRADLVQMVKEVYNALPQTSAATLASKSNVLGAQAVASSVCITVGASLGTITDMSRTGSI